MSFGSSGPSRAEKEAMNRQNDLLAQQQNTLKQQAAQKAQLAKQAEQERIAALRGRFGGLGGGGSGSSDGTEGTSLYSRITGR